MGKVILCVTEGEKTEVTLLTALHKTFLSKETIEFVSYKTSIYQLYKHLNKDEFLDTYGILKEISNKNTSNTLANYSRDDIAEIYLFFDLDAHDNLAEDNPNCFEEMLTLFDNETENGKLYISYPMVEAFKHPLKQAETFEISQGKLYKKYVATMCDTKLNNFSNHALDKAQWSQFLVEHIKAINFLISDIFTYPQTYQDTRDIFTQTNIYQNQFDKFVNPSNKVLVLSPFALFLLEYLGKPLFEEWQKIAK